MHGKSLYELYSEQAESYYGIKYKAEDLFSFDLDISQVRCRKFLHNHYMKGKKAALLSSTVFDQYEQNGKHIHSASLYLLGKVLLSVFQGHLGRELGVFLPHYMKWHDHSWDFLHTWYLPSMFHDFASCIELSTINKDDSERHKSLNFHLGNHNIQYSPYGNFSYKSEEIPFRFSAELIENYFYYRACNGKCDHGIIAGFLFFDRFIKNFKRHTNGGGKVFDEDGNMIISDLNWNIDLPMYAAYAADSIICHNIWMGGKCKEEEYIEYGLAPLLYNRHPENKLSVNKFPLQFMLCILDTIEPTKRFSEFHSPRGILQAIYIKTDSDMEISLGWDHLISESDNFQQWLSGIKSMEDWMDVLVEIGACGVKIKFR